MDANYITLTVTGQKLKATDKQVIASGGINNVKCRFAFSDDWNGLTKTAVFTSDQPYKQALDDKDECFIPALAMTEAGYIEISVYGELDGEMRQTSTVLTYEIKQGSDVTEEDIIASIKGEAVTEIKSDIIATLSQIYTEYKIENVPNFSAMSVDELVSNVMSSTTMIVSGMTETRITEQTKTAIVDCLTQIAEYYDIDSADYADMSVYQVIANIPTTLNSAVEKTLNQANDKDVTELRQALSTATGEDYTEFDFNGLIEAVESLPVMTAEVAELAEMGNAYSDIFRDDFSILRLPKTCTAIDGTKKKIIFNSEKAKELYGENVTSVKDWQGAFTYYSSLQIINLPNATTVTQFNFTSPLKEIYMDSLTSTPSRFCNFRSLKKFHAESLRVIGEYSFQNTTNLIELHAPNVTSLGGACFDNSGIAELHFPKVSGLDVYHMMGVLSLKILELGTITGKIQKTAFSDACPIENLIIGAESTGTMDLSNLSNLTPECVCQIIENYADMTGKTAPTLTLASSVGATVSAEYLEILESKNINYVW